MAMQFNLLPWREERRQEKFDNNRNTLLGALAIGVLAGLGYYGWEKATLSDHDKALAMVSNKNKSLEPQLAEKRRLDALKIELINQVDAIEALQADRASVSHMVEELSIANNQELFLTSFSLKNKNVVISGIAKNDNQISELMLRLRESEWYQEPKLQGMVSQKDKGPEVKSFSITSQLLYPSKDLNSGGNQ